jgi:hypothetical protein
MNAAGYSHDDPTDRGIKTPGPPPEADAPDERWDEMSSQRVEHALRRFERSWLNRHYYDPGAVEQDLDELDVAVGLWLDSCRTARRS